VAEYYDENTKRFLGSGAGRGEDAIHRPVWAPEIAARSEAVHFVDEAILRRITETEAKGVLDLGCGVGGTISYMRNRVAAEFLGITISSVQQRMGALRLAGLKNTRIACGDMADPTVLLPARESLPSPTVAFCIESFLHVPDGLQFLEDLANALRPGDTLCVCDDFLIPGDLSGSAARTVRAFQEGWHAPSLLTADSVVEAARDCGLEQTINDDLTQFLRLGQTKNLAIRGLVLLLSPFPVSGAATLSRKPWRPALSTTGSSDSRKLADPMAQRGWRQSR
jgi:SAM-dependent methyltransferase